MAAINKLNRIYIFLFVTVITLVGFSKSTFACSPESGCGAYNGCSNGQACILNNINNTLICSDVDATGNICSGQGDTCDYNKGPEVCGGQAANGCAATQICTRDLASGTHHCVEAPDQCCIPKVANAGCPSMPCCDSSAVCKGDGTCGTCVGENQACNSGNDCCSNQGLSCLDAYGTGNVCVKTLSGSGCLDSPCRPGSGNTGAPKCKAGLECRGSGFSWTCQPTTIGKCEGEGDTCGCTGGKICRSGTCGEACIQPYQPCTQQNCCADGTATYKCDSQGGSTICIPASNCASSGGDCSVSKCCQNSSEACDGSTCVSCKTGFCTHDTDVCCEINGSPAVCNEVTKTCVSTTGCATQGDSCANKSCCGSQNLVCNSSKVCVPGSVGGQCTGSGCGVECPAGERCSNQTCVSDPICDATIFTVPYNGPIINVAQFLSSVFKVMYPLAIVLGIAFIIKAGYSLMTSEGDPMKVKAGQEELTAAIIGTLFILLSVVILRVIMVSIIGASVSF